MKNRINRSVLYILLSYYVVDAQARIQKTGETFEHFMLLDTNRFIGHSALEWIVLFFVLFLVMNSHLSKTSDLKKLLPLLYGMLALSLVSIVVVADDKVVGLRTAFVYLRPVVIFLLVASMSWAERDLASAVKFVGTFFVINLVVAYFQMLVLGYRTDDLSGFMDDAHVFAFFMYSGILYCIARYWVTKELKHLAFVPVILVPTLVASADKITILMIPAILLLYRSFHELSLKKVVKGIAVAFVLCVIILVLFFSFPEMWQQALLGDLGRFSDLLTFENIPLILSQVRLFDGYWNIPWHYVKYPHAAFVGVGPGMYGSAEALADFLDITTREHFGGLAESPLKNFALGGSYFLENQSLFSTMTTSFASSDIIVLLLEFGLVFSFLYFKFWKSLYKFSMGFKDSDLSPGIRTLLLWFQAYMILVLLLGFITFQDGIVKASNTYPFMIIGAIMFRTLSNWKREVGSVEGREMGHEFLHARQV